MSLSGADLSYVFLYCLTIFEIAIRPLKIETVGGRTTENYSLEVKGSIPVVGPLPISIFSTPMTNSKASGDNSPAQNRAKLVKKMGHFLDSPWIIQ